MTTTVPGSARRRNAGLFVSVSLVAGFGGGAMSLVAGVWVMALTGSASLAALVGLCMYLPTLFGPVLGAMVDRFPRRRLLVWTNITVAAPLAAAGLFTLVGRPAVAAMSAVMLLGAAWAGQQCTRSLMKD